MVTSSIQAFTPAGLEDDPWRLRSVSYLVGVGCQLFKHRPFSDRGSKHYRVRFDWMSGFQIPYYRPVYCECLQLQSGCLTDQAGCEAGGTSIVRMMLLFLLPPCALELGSPYWTALLRSIRSAQVPAFVLVYKPPKLMARVF